MCQPNSTVASYKASTEIQYKHKQHTKHKEVGKN